MTEITRLQTPVKCSLTPALTFAGIAARGARTKMLKSIETLRMRNETREASLAQIEMAMDSAPVRKALLGLSEMMQMPSPDEDAQSSGNFASTVCVCVCVCVCVSVCVCVWLAH
jgi:hypothetical protein